MPAPLAKGLIISFSLLFAAGLAIYENPQVRQWVDESRRKVALALHSLGEEVAPQQSESRDASPDASTREAEDSEAIERRRKARQEILERGRILEERRRSKRSSQGKTSFNDLVDKDGSLKVANTSAMTTAAESPLETGLRNRHADSQAAAQGSAFSNPFSDETGIGAPTIEDDIPQADAETLPTRPPKIEETEAFSPLTLRGDTEEKSPSPSTTPLLYESPTSPPIPPKPAAYRSQHLLIDTDEVSNHPSESLLDLTPTTSTSSAAVDLNELNNNLHPSQSSYWSVNEWAESQAASFYSPPRSEVVARENTMDNQNERSEAGSGEHASQAGTEEVEILSDDGAGIITPSSWTEVGSQVSEEY
ncbi:hypothetical protein P7C71_g700, partial [Lecanoromycetidae sp. Uapishka_2]